MLTSCKTRLNTTICRARELSISNLPLERHKFYSTLMTPSKQWPKQESSEACTSVVTVLTNKLKAASKMFHPSSTPCCSRLPTSRMRSTMNSETIKALKVSVATAQDPSLTLCRSRATFQLKTSSSLTGKGARETFLAKPLSCETFFKFARKCTPQERTF